MDRINEFDLEHGVYKGDGGHFVVTEVVTHQYGDPEALSEPLVVFRDLEIVQRRVKGRLMTVHQRYQLPISLFKKHFEFLR